MNYPHSKQTDRLWTGTRLALTALALTLTAAVASSCSDANETANSKTPTVSIKSAPAAATNTTNAPANASANAPAPAPGALELMPESVMQKEVALLDGKKFKLSDYKGKVVVVDLWATWCGPCRQSIPHLVELRDRFKPEQLEIIGLTTEDPATDEAKVRAFAQQFKINYKVGWVEGDMAITLMRGRNAIPQALVLTKDGRLLKHLIGFSPSSSPQVLTQAIEQAMNMPS